jgi:hypothetical protein
MFILINMAKFHLQNIIDGSIKPTIIYLSIKEELKQAISLSGEDVKKLVRYKTISALDIY